MNARARLDATEADRATANEAGLTKAVPWGGDGNVNPIQLHPSIVAHPESQVLTRCLTLKTLANGFLWLRRFTPENFAWQAK